MGEGILCVHRVCHVFDPRDWHVHRICIFEVGIPIMASYYKCQSHRLLSNNIHLSLDLTLIAPLPVLVFWLNGYWLMHVCVWVARLRDQFPCNTVVYIHLNMLLVTAHPVHALPCANACGLLIVVELVNIYNYIYPCMCKDKVYVHCNMSLYGLYTVNRDRWICHTDSDRYMSCTKANRALYCTMSRVLLPPWEQLSQSLWIINGILYSLHISNGF
jgi:hypothetical protein